MPFANLPGTQIGVIDGGLSSNNTPTGKSTLIVATAGQGPANQPYQVVSPSAAATLFGLQGSMIQAMEEVLLESSNVILYRMGTTPMEVLNLGLELGTQESISNVVVASSIATFTTSAAHGFSVGNLITITGLVATGTTGLNSTYIVASVPTSTTFTVVAPTGIVTLTSTVIAAGSAATVVSPGINITFSNVDSTSLTDYSIWYSYTSSTPELAVWDGTSLVYSNITALGITNSGDITFSNPLGPAILLGGLAIGSGSPSQSTAIAVGNISGLTGSATNPLPTVVSPNIGINLTGRQKYIALAQALNSLTNLQVDQIYCPDATVDAPSVAYYVPSNPATFNNSPTLNANALDWINVTQTSGGPLVYQWANDTVNSLGQTVTPMSSSVTTSAERLAAGFYEASFAYLVANFCYQQDQENGGCLGFIGTSGPATFNIVDTTAWVGYLPIYNAQGQATTSGSGLLGIPTLTGCQASTLNPLAAGFTQGYRSQGYFATLQNQYDGSVISDTNGYPVDIGSYLVVVAEYANISNSFASNYSTNLAGFAAGFCSTLDEKSGLLNKPVNVTQRWYPSNTQGNNLTKANIIVLRFKGLNKQPAWLNDATAAGPLSSYNKTVNLRIRFMVENLVRKTADPFIGNATNDGLQLNGMVTALNKQAQSLKKRGYVSNATFTIVTSLTDLKAGHVTLQVLFTPAFELVQLNTTVSLTAA